MRVVRNPRAAPAGAEAEDPAVRAAHRVPREALESVRYLSDRASRHGIRPVQLLRAAPLDPLADPSGSTRVWVALETMQATGSFKVRGAFAALQALSARTLPKRVSVVAASAGNHGAGVAFAARALGADATVVVPRGVPDTKRAKIEGYGATIVVGETDSFDDAEAKALAMAADRGVPFVSAYDDVDVLAGNGGSLGFEIARALGTPPGAVLVPFGGGGLATGLASALAIAARDAGVSPGPVWGAQSEASPAMALSLERGAAVVSLEAAGPTIAEGLEGGISARAFARAREVVAGVVVVSEGDAARAMAYAYREMGLVVEGSAAVALAPVLAGLPEAVLAAEGDPPGDLVVVLTGRNVDVARLARVLAEDGARDGAPRG